MLASVLDLLIPHLTDDARALCSLRQCCCAFGNSESLCRAVADRHLVLPAWRAVQGGARHVSSWREALRNCAAFNEHFSRKLSLQDFEGPVQALGDGPMSLVDLYRVRNTDWFVALKTYAKQTLVKFDSVAQASAERDALAALRRHPSILKLFNAFQSADSVHMVLEFCPFGDLVDCVRREPEKRLPYRVCVDYLLQLFGVLQYIHERGYVHRDIKAENILVGSDGRIRLADFALCYVRGTVCQKAFVGSVQYVAPEIIAGAKIPTEKVDIFGAGNVGYYLKTGKFAFLRDTEYLTMVAIKTEEPVFDVEDPLTNVLAATLIKQEEQRPDAKQVFEMLKKL